MPAPSKELPDDEILSIWRPRVAMLRKLWIRSSALAIRCCWWGRITAWAVWDIIKPPCHTILLAHEFTRLTNDVSCHDDNVVAFVTPVRQASRGPASSAADFQIPYTPVLMCSIESPRRLKEWTSAFAEEIGRASCRERAQV